MADGTSSVTTTTPRTPNSSLPIEYQVRPRHLPVAAESPLTGLAANPYRARSVWYELWKSKFAFFILITSSTLIYYDYQRTQRYKAEKALKASQAEAQTKK